MMARSITTQFAIYVSLAASLVLLAVAFVSVAVIQHQLTRSADQNAHNFLADYLAQVGLGPPSSDDSLEVYRIFYLDEQGENLSWNEINNLLEKHIDELLTIKIEADMPAAPADQWSEGEYQVVSESIELTLIDVADIDIKPVSLSPERVAIGQLVRLGGEQFTVGVSYPESLVQQRVDAVVTGFQFAVPVLVMLAGITTWLAVRHAMKPVVSMAHDANRINEQYISQRLEVPVAQNEFRYLATTLNAMLERIEKGQKAQEQFIADASHELRSPLTATKLLIEISQQDPTSVNWPDTLKAMAKENNRVIGLVDDLLTLAKLDESQQSQLEMLDLKSRLLEEAERARKNRVIVSVPDSVGVLADASQFQTLMDNLLDNADRYAETTIMVNVVVSENNLELTVEDDGPGIPLEHREGLFDRFVRLDKSRFRDVSSNAEPKPHGAGLGLAIARAIAVSHGWLLHLSDSALGGACFRLTIPYDEKMSESNQARAESAGCAL